MENIPKAFLPISGDIESDGEEAFPEIQIPVSIYNTQKLNLHNVYTHAKNLARNWGRGLSETLRGFDMRREFETRNIDYTFKTTLSF